MLRRGLLGIALATVGLLTADTAQAQIGIGIGVGGYRGGGVGFYYGNPGYYGRGYYGGYSGYGGYYGRGYYDPYYYRSGVYVRPSYYYPPPVYVQPAPIVVQPVEYRQAVPGPQPVYVNIQVPPDAEVWFDGAKTTQTGPTRRFVSPPLAPGRNYSYEVTATWMKDGNPVTEKRTVSFEAGRQSELNVDLRPAP